MNSEDSNNVGILAVEVYFPSTYVTQEDLEVANGVSKGKYTIGLGQEAMAFTGDHEDINSIALTVVHSLMEKYKIQPSDIGRLEVGTESLVDKSKSTKTVIMSLFEGNTDVEGATVVNACYGGTAALLNALTWADSSSWDGRYAIVVAADIAVYADGPARPTGGCGSVALLVGRNAPLAIDLKTRSTFANHCWDFFKPNLDSEYPTVNGALSQTCYLQALDSCYEKFLEKTKRFRNKSLCVTREIDFMLFHSPYNKLVQKSFGRLLYQDMLLGHVDVKPVEKFLSLSREKSYEDKELETALKSLSAGGYASKVDVSCKVSKQIGNTYTASVWMNLANLVSNYGNELLKKEIVLFSYGSGALATMFQIIPRDGDGLGGSADRKFSLENIQKQLNVMVRLAAREKLSPNDLSIALKAREDAHLEEPPFRPRFSIEKLSPGTYYLAEINKGYERIYHRKPLTESHRFGGELMVSASSTIDDEDIGVDIDDFSSLPSPSPSQSMKATTFALPSSLSPRSGSNGSTPMLSRMTRSVTQVFASGRRNVSVVVTGVSAGLPGRNGEVFSPNNISRIIHGESFITELPDYVKESMISKNLFEVVKNPDKTVSKVPISSFEKGINVSASLGNFSLTSYGISESLVGTMDRAVQVAIAAGLEALKDAGIVSGEGVNGWVLPESMQQSTGIVYATSFPALDTAIEEVSKYFKEKTLDYMTFSKIIPSLRKRLEVSLKTTALSEDTEAALKKLQELFIEGSANGGESKGYEFDRKFLFRVLVLGNAQLAQIIHAKGPNMQTNAACAGATQAIALAYDMIQVGRAERVVVIAGDSAASDTLMPWLGSGFRTLGAATTCSSVKLASRPFHPERSGMILGSGGIGIVLESEDGANRRHALSRNPSARRPFKCKLLGTLLSNSAYHGASMDREHIAQEMERFISSIENELKITRKEIAAHGVYFSHETSTHASATSSCAANEIYGLRKVFKEDLKNLLILNTKGFTGHPMGVSFEDVVAAEVLQTGKVPPIANFSEVDPALGNDLSFSKGGDYPCKYAMRFAAGFGSQIALALYGAADV